MEEVSNDPDVELKRALLQATREFLVANQEKITERAFEIIKQKLEQQGEDEA